MADRFHLLQNMPGHLKDGLCRLVPLRIAFEIPTLQMPDGIPAKTVPESALIAGPALLFEYDNTPPCVDGEAVGFSVSSCKSGKQKERQEKVARIKAIQGEFDPSQKKDLAGRNGRRRRTRRSSRILTRYW